MFWSHRGIGFQYYQTSHPRRAPAPLWSYRLKFKQRPCARIDCVNRSGPILVFCALCVLYFLYCVKGKVGACFENSLTAAVGHGKSWTQNIPSVLRILERFCATRRLHLPNRT